MQKKNTKGKIRLSFIAAILCIGFFVLITYRNMLLTESESRYIKSSVDVLLKLENILTDVQDIESGQRGFVITGNDDFLEPYYQALDNLKRDTSTLHALTADNSFLLIICMSSSCSDRKFELSAVNACSVLVSRFKLSRAW